MQKQMECKYFIQGVCNKGNHCRFIHSGIPNQQNKFENKMKKSNIDQRSKFHKHLNKKFKEDFHQKPNHNQFQFQEEDQFQNKQRQHGQKQCRFFQQGHCKRGDQCRFEHNGGNQGNERQRKNRQQDTMQIDQGHLGNQMQMNQGAGDDQQNQLIMNQCKEFFSKGSCQFKNCRRSHQASLEQDLLIFGKQKYSNESIIQILKINNNQQEQLLLVCLDRMVLLNDQYEVINQEMQPQHNKISYVAQYQQSLFIGFYDECQKISIVNIIIQSQPVQFKQIQPAHEDKITKMAVFESCLLTSSLDQKVKMWKLDGQLQFVLQSSYSHSQKVVAMEVIDNLIVIGDIQGGLAILQMQNQIEILRSLDGYHDNAITDIYKFNDYIFTVSLDGRMKLMDFQQQIQDYQMNGPINSIGFLKNKKQKQLIALGYCDGNVELYDDSISLYGKIPTHSYQKTKISVIYNQFSNINEVVGSKLLIADLSGIISFWEFENL